MQILGSSSMACFWFTFRFLCIVCCIIAITSYKIDHHLSIPDRNKRAVTEWRFRRDHLYNVPYFFRSHIKNNHLINNEANDNYQDDEIKLYEKKFIIPQLMYPEYE